MNNRNISAHKYITLETPLALFPFNPPSNIITFRIPAIFSSIAAFQVVAVIPNITMFELLIEYYCIRGAVNVKRGAFSHWRVNMNEFSTPSIWRGLRGKKTRPVSSRLSDVRLDGSQRKGESPWRRYFPGIGPTRRSTQMRTRRVIK